MARKRRHGKNGVLKPKKGSGDAGRGGNNSLGEWAKSLLIAVVLFLIIRTFLAQTFVIISGSMEGTLLVGDLLLVNRAAVGSRVPGTSMRIPGYTTPERGDVLVFDPHHEVDMKLVKRLLGLPGDTLEMRGKQLYINGERLSEPYARHETDGDDLTDPIMMWQRDFLLPGTDRDAYQPTRDDWGPIIIPEEYYFMLGDNRDLSYDSRYWGPLEQWRIEGRVVLIYFSYNKQPLRPFPWLREIRWGRILDLVR
jgi:signal peptidase I